MLLAMVPAAFAGLVRKDARNSHVVCETSGASPFLHNINEMVDNLKKEPKGTNLCTSGNGCGGTETKWSGSGGAAFMLCGYRVSPFTESVIY